MTQPRQHLKLLYIAKMLYEKTDEEHPISIAEMIQGLAEEGIPAERKSVYSDIECLEAFGLDIVTVKAKCNRYYIASRQFELPELKLLADAVCSARFLTEKKSEQLLHKIESLAGVHEGMLIERQVMVVDRVKSMNEQIYINVDTIHKAINEGRQISFRYFDYSTNKRKVYRAGERVCSPCALTWNDEKYYLVSYYLKYPDNYTNFRVDRMSDICILDEPVLKSPKELNISEYLNSTFSMFSGDTVEAVLKFDKKLINPVIDRFGINTDIVNLDIDHFKIKVDIKAKPPFFAWLFQFGKAASIISPEALKEDYKKMLTEVISSFDE